MKTKNNILKSLLTNLIFLIISVSVFVLANPNPLIKDGIFILGFFSYWPVLILVNRTSIKNVCLYGGVYGSLSYGIYAYWLHSFHPLGIAVVCIYYFILLAVVFLGLKVIDLLFKEHGWLLQWLLICSYEYLKTLGFAGFSYGVTAYTQWKNIYFIQFCNIFGVFGLNLIVIFLSCWVYNFFGRELKSKKVKYISLGLWGITIVSAYTYGFIFSNTKESGETVKVLAVQNNEDPWKNGIDEYSRNIQRLKVLTDEAFELNPDIDIVVWPETAVVPSIMYQYYQGKDPKRYKVINSLLSYMDSRKCAFVIGNAHEVDSKRGVKERYNSAFVFEAEQNVYPPNPDVYSKRHLVPFTETFPYKKYFPGLYSKLLNGDTHMWEPGKDYTVFETKGLNYSTPICFEDTFGEDCRHFVLNGARCFLNLSNDGWSKSLTCQNQHMAMAVFRSVENGVPTIRSTSTGQTCHIDKNGRVIGMAPAFCETYLVGNVPVLNQNFKTSIYTRYGDIAGKVTVCLCIVLLIIQIFIVIIKKLTKHN